MHGPKIDALVLSQIIHDYFSVRLSLLQAFSLPLEMELSVNPGRCPGLSSFRPSACLIGRQSCVGVIQSLFNPIISSNTGLSSNRFWPDCVGFGKVSHIKPRHFLEPPRPSARQITAWGTRPR